jgi:hypothetical protein
MTTIELGAVAAWKAWGSEWALHTACSGCGEVKPCRGKRRAKMLCLACFDLR